ncbi:MAG: hypothetical protein WCI02_10665 [Planctomycetota bacterium]
MQRRRIKNRAIPSAPTAAGGKNRTQADRNSAEVGSPSPSVPRSQSEPSEKRQRADSDSSSPAGPHFRENTHSNPNHQLESNSHRNVSSESVREHASTNARESYGRSESSNTQRAISRSPKGCQPTDRPGYQSRLRELLLEDAARWKDSGRWEQNIRRWVLEQSQTMDGENFRRISDLDLERMAEAYDRQFFQGLCLPLARSFGLHFRLSSRMTRAGGKTTRQVFRTSTGKDAGTRFEIALSTNLLFQSFRRKGDRTRVCGIECTDRLSAMQRVVEHEMIHLCEMLVWIQSDCSARRFQGIAHRLFQHTEHRHELVTPQERAIREFDIRPGTRVEFEANGMRRCGIVNRITTRATVLVPDLSGPRYNDGHHYAKYYVPIQQLHRLD